MKRILLMILLSAICNSAMAEWSYIGDNDDVTIYVDSSTIKKRGSTAKIWVLFDYKAPRTLQSGASYLSLKRLNEFDCKKDEERMLSFVIAADHMGKGDALPSSEKTEWNPIIPDSATAEVSKYACGIKK